MQYAYTLLYVKDVAASLDFYEAAFGFARKFMTEEGDYGELATGGVTIGFADYSLGKSNFSKGFQPTAELDKPVGVELAFVSKDLEADFAKAVAAGATVYEPLQHKMWGQQVGYVLDNNGFLIELCSPMPEE